MLITGCFKSSFRFFLHLNFTWLLKIPFVKLSMLFIIHLTLTNWNISNQNVFIYDFWHFLSGDRGIECTSSHSVSKFTFFHAKRSRCRSSSSLFFGGGAQSVHVVSPTIIQMISRGFTSREFASRSSFSISLQILLKPYQHKVCTTFFLYKAFQPLLVTYLHTVVLETLILWSWNFFLPFCLVGLLCIYLQLFW